MRKLRMLDYWRPAKGSKDERMWGDGTKENMKERIREKGQDRLWGMDLGCSACKWTSKRVLFHLTKAIKGKGSSKAKVQEQRREAALKVLPDVCGDSPPWPEQFAIAGNMTDREFIDHVDAKGWGNEKALLTVKHGGNITEDDEHAGYLQKKIQKFCEMLTKNNGFEKDLADLVAQYKGRVGDIKYDFYLCFDRFDFGDLCTKDQVPPNMNDEADDEEEEQEL
eukprot:gnl/TRDRNA2_/TRDRNA2_165214_c1_seq1.p1 gnl/TRDRNA2_/TRDRNA2_165214_c1~~gnl/TRDRNA2_/TRDRNA2_165214_c1_seq1.p1  ORF type:complete len:223 (+),score=62.60 gnl/TRDRNA2_/TRDRNA2_165214_c1_seq1:349-1017(+)